MTEQSITAEIIDEDKPLKPKRSDDETAKILKIAKAEYKKSVKAFSDSYKEAMDTIKFKEGISQWTESEIQDRADSQRPALTLNELPKFSLQVCGEMRKNKVQIKCSPADEKGSQAQANIRAGLIKNIEYQSKAEAIYDHASKMMVDGGFGAARVLSRYTDNEKDPFQQDLYIKSIDNPFSVHTDPDAEDKFFITGEYCFIDSFMEREEFIDAYGEDVAPAESQDASAGTENEGWYEKGKVLIKEYYKKEYTVKTMVQLSDGQFMEEKDAKKFIAGVKTAYEAAKADQDKKRAEAVASGLEFAEQPIDVAGVPTIVKKRKIEVPKIIWRKITADTILEEEDVPGELLPVSLLTGEYTNIAGKKVFSGMFKHAKGAARMLNHAYTTAWEIIALMPKTPIQASAKMVEGYDKDYLSANKENFPLLKFRADPDFPGGKPERMPIGQTPVAIFQMLQDCKQDIKDTIGMFDADTKGLTASMSDRAVIARKTPGETAMYTYPDNRDQWIASIGEILNDKLAYYYDTERDVRLRGDNGKDSFMPINTTAGKASAAIKENPAKYSGMNKAALGQALKKGPATPFNNITDGKYSVVMSSGPAYATQRQEQAETIIKIAQVAGKLPPAYLWHLVKTQDGPGMDDWADTIKKMTPQGMLPQKEDEQPAPPMPPSPQQQMAMGKMQLEMEKQKTEKLKQQKQIVELQLLLSQTKEGMNSAIIAKLDEMMAPEHPADNMQQGEGM